MELGLYTFADVDPTAARGPEGARRLKNLLEEIELADQVGLDVFGVGEHHRPDYAVSSPSTVLAAAAVKTKNIRLTSAVSVISSDDPVRLFQQFSTVDLLSGGRAEIMAGRGSFIESFPLFGYNLEDYDDLFSEKLGMLMKLNEAETVTWKGEHTATINGRGGLSASVAGEAAAVDRGGWHAAIGGTGGVARPAGGACHHRWRISALCTALQSLPRGGTGGGAG